MKIQKEMVAEDALKQKPADVLAIPFGTVFTDHMLSMTYSSKKWSAPRIHAFGPIAMNPAALCLHYGQGIFEGMKAYRRGDRIRLFRPRKNFERLNISAARMVMPSIDPDVALEGLIELLRIERDWIPQAKGSSLYIRPTLIGTEPKLGVRPSNEYLFFIILSPVGPYFKAGFAPVKIYVSDEYVRAVRGGVGSAKAMGNYAASLYAGTEATKVGSSQVLWLDALERKYLEEVGTMNVAVIFDDELATPPLSGTILPGITRDSVLTMARSMGINVNERKISIDEVLEGLKSGKVKEMFGCGTAAVIAPIGSLWYKGSAYTIADGKTGESTRALFDELTGIQSGEREDPYDWVVEVS